MTARPMPRTARLFLYDGAGRSIREIARMVGMKPSTLHFRLVAKGMSVAEAVAMPLTPKHLLNPAGRRPRLFEYRGEMLDAKTIADRMGRERSTVYRRLVGNRVVDLGEIIDPFRSYQDAPTTCTLIFHAGETLTVAEWARRSGIDKETVYSRLRQGWNPVTAITAPPGPQYAKRTLRRRNRSLIARMVRAFHGQGTGGISPTFPNPQGTGGRSTETDLERQELTP